MRVGRSLGCVAAVWVLLSSSASGAAAQGARRGGFWLEGGTGTGTVRNQCSACTSVTVTYGRSRHLRVGGAIGPGVLLGVELFTLDSSDLSLQQGVPVVDAKNGSVAPVVLWYVGSSGLFLKGGVGLSRGTFAARSPQGVLVTTKRTGSALSFDVGFDIGITRRFAVTANLGTYVMAIGDVHVNGTVVDDLVATIYEAGIGLTLR